MQEYVNPKNVYEFSFIGTVSDACAQELERNRRHRTSGRMTRYRPGLYPLATTVRPPTARGHSAAAPARQTL